MSSSLHSSSPSPTLPTRRLSRDSPEITGLGFGTMGLSVAYGPPGSNNERLDFLDYVYNSGERLWDTSDMYGDSEDLLGARSGKRADIFLSSKFGVVPGGFGVLRSDPAYVKQACEKSLRRLGVQTIDLYYVHRVDRTTPIEETVKAMAELKAEGKIRYLGLSEVSAKSVRRAHKMHTIHAIQIEYSPFSLDIEQPTTSLLATCRELGISVVAYSPLGRGFLTGKYRSPEDFHPHDYRRYLPRFSPENFSKNLQLVKNLDRLAVRKGIPTGTLVLAWLLAQGPDIIPIPGTTNRTNLDENLMALTVKLSDEEVDEIRTIVDEAGVAGERYDARGMSYCLSDTPPWRPN